MENQDAGTKDGMAVEFNDDVSKAAPQPSADERLQKILDKALYADGNPEAQKLRNFLNGTWLGEPLHVVLTDLPIGAWTAAMVFDLLDLMVERGQRVVTSHVQACNDIAPLWNQCAPASSENEAKQIQRTIDHEQVGAEPVEPKRNTQHSWTEAQVVIKPVWGTTVVMQAGHVGAQPNTDVRSSIEVSRRIGWMLKDRS